MQRPGYQRIDSKRRLVLQRAGLTFVHWFRRYLFDGFAHRAWMIAIKCFLHTRNKIFLLCVRDQHAGPGGRLQNHPLASREKNNQRENKCRLYDMVSQHDRKILTNHEMVKVGTIILIVRRLLKTSSGGAPHAATLQNPLQIRV